VWVAACGSTSGGSGRTDADYGPGEPDSGSAPRAAAAVSPPGTARDSAPTILFVGTSLTAGYGLDPDSAYPAIIQRKIDSAGFHHVVRNAGESGETSAGARRRIEWLLRGNESVVVIETGANDGLRGVNPDSTLANLRAILATVRARVPGARMVLAGMRAPPNLGADYTRRFMDVFPLAAREHDAELVPFLLEGVAGLAAMNQPDAIHPNEAGSRVVAATVWRVLAPLLMP
jgi:acyl-CoA thioesterase-1